MRTFSTQRSVERRNSEFEVLGFDDISLGGDRSGVVEDVASDGIVVPFLRDGDMELFL